MGAPIDTKSIHHHAGQVNTKSIDSANQGCARAFGLATGAIGIGLKCIDPNDQAARGSRWAVRRPN